MADLEGLKRQMEEDGKAYLPRIPLTDAMVAYPPEYLDAMGLRSPEFGPYDPKAELSLNQMQEIVAHLTYKPGWRLQVVEQLYDPVLLIEMEAPDTYAQVPGPPIRVRHMRPLSWAFSKDDLLKTVRRALHDVEMHEADEWLKWAGETKPIFDPHAND